MYATMVASFGGILFGYDTAALNGKRHASISHRYVSFLLLLPLSVSFQQYLPYFFVFDTFPPLYFRYIDHAFFPRNHGRASLNHRRMGKLRVMG